MLTLWRSGCAAIILCIGLAGLAEAQPAMPAPATPPGNAELDAWVGTWNATGTFMGMPATETVTFSWVAGGFELEGHHTRTVTGADGSTTTIETVTIWRPNADGSFSAWFFDSMGMALDVTGTTEANTVHFSATLPNGMTSAATVEHQADGTEHYTEQDTMPDGSTMAGADMTYTKQ
jgi:hypothetical protein